MLETEVIVGFLLAGLEAVERGMDKVAAVVGAVAGACGPGGWVVELV